MIKQISCFMLGAILFVFSAPVVAQPTKIPRIGALHLGTLKAAAPVIDTLQRDLRELGYIEGSTITVDYRYAEGKAERYSALAAELVAMKPALILVWGTDVAEYVAPVWL